MIENLRMKQKALEGYQKQRNALNEKQIILTNKVDYADYKLSKLQEAQLEKENEKIYLRNQQLAQAAMKSHKKRLRKHRKH